MKNEKCVCFLTTIWFPSWQYPKHDWFLESASLPDSLFCSGLSNSYISLSQFNQWSLDISLVVARWLQRRLTLALSTAIVGFLMD